MAPDFAQAIQEAAGIDAAFVTFIDLDEDGKLDFLIQKFGANSNLDTPSGMVEPSVVTLFNNMYFDNFYMKAMMLNSAQSKSNNIYGDLTVGCSYRFITTDLEDKQHVVVGAQGYQQSYMSLMMPYSFMGLGRSNNYVEIFTAGTAVNAELGS